MIFKGITKYLQPLETKKAQAMLELLCGLDGNARKSSYLVVCQLFICVSRWFGVGFGAKSGGELMLYEANSLNSSSNFFRQ